MPHLHPTDRTLAQLVDGRLDSAAAADARGHIEACARCRMRIGQSLPGVERTQPASQALNDLAIDTAESRDVEPAFGDIWRLAWDDTVVLGVVWYADATSVTVLPLAETVDADDWCAVLRSGHSTFDEIAVSVALRASVPWSVLDARVSRLVDMDVLVTLVEAYEAGVEPNGIKRGAPIQSALDERSGALDELRDDLGLLAGTVWAATEPETPAMKFDFDTLSAAGILVNRAFAIVRGATPSTEEADLIESATGVRPSQNAVPLELQQAIDLPARKHRIRARARQHHHGEAVERLALARQAEPALAAARGTKGQPLDYNTILDRLLHD